MIGRTVVDTNDNTLGIVEDIDVTGNLLVIRGSVDSREYSVPKNSVVNVDKSSNKIVIQMTKEDFIKYAKA
jgi:ribosomal 30S subunit maturation factor RimM